MGLACKLDSRVVVPEQKPQSEHLHLLCTYLTVWRVLCSAISNLVGHMMRCCFRVTFFRGLAAALAAVVTAIRRRISAERAIRAVIGVVMRGS